MESASWNSPRMAHTQSFQTNATKKLLGGAARSSPKTDQIGTKTLRRAQLQRQIGSSSRSYRRSTEKPLEEPKKTPGYNLCVYVMEKELNEPLLSLLKIQGDLQIP